MSFDNEKYLHTKRGMHRETARADTELAKKKEIHKNEGKLKKA